jgi:hypothetical protein
VNSLKNTDKFAWYWNTYGTYPWNVLMTHMYPGGELPENFIPNQSNMLRGVQSRPIWVTESGWFGTNQAEQADMLNRAYNKALSGYADKYFWFALYDCSGEPYGLIADCGNPDGAHRTSYGTYKALTGGGGGGGGGIPLNRWISIRAAANNMYVCADLSRMNPPELIANRGAVGAWEKFYVQDLGGGNVALYANANANYVCADVGRTNPPILVANRTGFGLWETFQWIDLGNQNFALRAQANGNLVCADNGGASPLIANRTTVGQWETFHWDPQ